MHPILNISNLSQLVTSGINQIEPHYLGYFYEYFPSLNIGNVSRHIRNEIRGKIEPQVSVAWQRTVIPSWSWSGNIKHLMNCYNKNL
jgi:hypothetical protein